MWTHVVLEVFDLDRIGFNVSKEEMQDRIDEGKYAWCVVGDDIVIYYVPLYKILWLKFKQYAENIHSFIYNKIYHPLYSRTIWGKRKRQELDAFWDSLPVITEEEEQELLREIFPEEFE